MSLDSLGEHLDGGAEVFDKYNRPVRVVVTKHQVPSSTDTLRGSTAPADADGRPQEVLQDVNGVDMGQDMHTVARLAIPTLLINGTQTFATYAIPSDGRRHFVECISVSHILTNMTGGQIEFQWTYDGVTTNVILQAGGQASGFPARNLIGAAVDPGSTIQVRQVSAMTAGSGTLTCMLRAD